MKLTALLIVFVAARATFVDGAAIQCPDVANGNVVIPHQFECSSFYLCDGSPTPSFLLRCPTGMFFGEEGTMGTGVTGGGCLQDAECRPQVEVTAVPTSRDARALPPVDTPGDYRNYTVHLRNPANCSQFYRYEGANEPQLFECPKGLGFDPVLESCDSKVKCRSPSTCQQGSPPVCPPNNDQLVHLPHPTDCTKFYKCNWGNPILFDCPDQLHFNPDLQVCDWPRNVPCNRCPSGDRTAGEPDEEVPDAEETDYDEPEGEPTGGEGQIDKRIGRQNQGRVPSPGPAGQQSAPGGQRRVPERGSDQSAGYASKGGRGGERPNTGQTAASGVQPNYRGQTNNQGYPSSNQGYQPSSQGYQPSSQGYQPNSQGYQPPSQEYQPPSQEYQPSSQGYQPNSQGHQPNSQGYQPPSQEYQPSSQGYQPNSQGYQPSSQGYKPPVQPYQPTNRQQGYPSAGQGYQPNSQGRQPGSRQPNQGYQPPTQEYQPDGRQQPGQEYQPTDNSWGSSSQDRAQPGQASRSLQGHRDHGSTTQIRQTVDGYPVYQPEATSPPRGQYQPSSATPRSQYRPSTVPPRSEYQPRPTPPVRRYLTAPQEEQGGTGGAGQYQPVMTMAPVGRYNSEGQAQPGERSDGQRQPDSHPDGQSQGEPRWLDGERPAPGPRVQMKPTSGLGGKPRYYQIDDQEQSIDTEHPQDRQPYNAQGRQPNTAQGSQQYNPQGRQPSSSQGRQPYDAQGHQSNEGQDRQPNAGQGRQPYNSQDRQPYDTQGRQPTDGQGRQWYDSQGRLLTVAQGRQPTGLQPTSRPSQPNASSQPPPSRDFHSVRVYHADSRTTWPPTGARTGQSTTPRYRQDGYQPRDPYQPLDQDTEQGPDSGIEQVSYSADHTDPDEQLYGSTARAQAANQRGGTAQQRSTTPQPASYSSRAHQRPAGGKYSATPRPEDSNEYQQQFDDDSSQPRTRSVDSQLPGLSDLRTRPVGSDAARSSDLRAEPPRPVYQHVMRIPTPKEIVTKA